VAGNPEPFAHVELEDIANFPLLTESCLSKLAEHGAKLALVSLSLSSYCG